MMYLHALLFIKEELSIQLAVLFCNDVHRKPSKQNINVSICYTCTVVCLNSNAHAQDMLGRVIGVDAVIPHKLHKALRFCNKKLADMRSEERRRVSINLYLFKICIHTI